MSTYETEITLTVTVYGVEVEVPDVPCTATYDYEPGERATRHDPGCDAEVSILAVTVDATGEDVTDEVDLDSLADAIRESVGDYEEDAREAAAERRAEERRDRLRYGGTP